MGSGNSKKAAAAQAERQLDAGGHDRGRRKSHVDTNPPPQSGVLVDCNTCGRRFAADRIGKHAEVCSQFLKGDRKSNFFLSFRCVRKSRETRAMFLTFKVNDLREPKPRNFVTTSMKWISRDLRAIGRGTTIEC